MNEPAWPHAERGRQQHVGAQHWHWLQWPAPSRQAPTVLLLHGTGASSHSWFSLAPLLATACAVLAVDLPGHGRSGPSATGRAGLPAMSAALLEWLDAIGAEPAWLVGHSAGAALAIEMTLQRPKAGWSLAGVNPAVAPLPGLAAHLFPPMAKLMAWNPLVPTGFAWAAREPLLVRQLLASTGSRLTPQAEGWYRRLVCDRSHVAGALNMMAQWDLAAFAHRIKGLRAPLHLALGGRDRTVSPAATEAFVTAWREAQPALALSLAHWPALGHLAHEEDAQTAWRWLQRCGCGAGAAAAS